MNKNLKKGLVTAVSAAMSIGIIVPAVSVLASSVLVPVTRIGGADRYSTAAVLATANGKKSDNVILVSGEGAYDAISATALASKLKAPILLTTAGSLNLNTSEALVTLGAKTVYIIGGTGSVSKSVRDILKGASYTLVQLDGLDRYDTNLKVANYLVNTEKVSAAKVLMAGGQGWSDALSVAPVAAAQGQILLLGNSDAKGMASTNKFVKDNKSVVTLVGTKNVIDDTELKTLGATRVDGGVDRFETNLKVNKAFSLDLNKDTTYIANATGQGFADALVGSAAAGVSKSPLVLVDTEISTATINALAYIKSLAPKAAVEVLGQTGVISENTFNSINIAVNNIGAGDLSVSSVSLNKTTDILSIGCTDTLISTVSPSNVTTKTVIWKTSNSTVATMTEEL